MVAGFLSILWMSNFFTEYSVLFSRVINYAYPFSVFILYLATSYLRISSQLLIHVFVLIFIMIISAVLTNYENDLKNVVNQTIFLTGSILYASFMSRSEHLIERVIYFKMVLLISIYILVSILFIINIDEVYLSYNSLYLNLSDMYLTKQDLSEIMIILIALTLNVRNRKIILILIILSLPIMLGLRTLVATFLGIVIFHKIRNLGLLRYLKYSFLLFLLVPFVLDEIPNWLYFDVRAIYFREVFSELYANPFGVGLWSVNEYLTNVHLIIPAKISSELGISGPFDFIHRPMTSLESDFLFLIMNMGVLGLFIYVAYIHMIDKFIEFCGNRSDAAQSLSNLLVGYFVAGFFEDYAFTVSWWMVHALAVAYALREQRRRGR